MTEIALDYRRTLIAPRTSISRFALVLGAAAFIALAAQVSIPLPFTPVPITGQTFAVLLVGTALGMTLGAASAALYVAVGVAGLPVFAEHKHGWEIVTSASGGYLFGFIIAAMLTGQLARRGWDRSFGASSASMLAGNVVIYLVGLPWLAVVLDTDLEKTLEYGLYPFVVGDLVKLYLAATILPTAWRFIERVGPGPRRSGRERSSGGRSPAWHERSCPTRSLRVSPGYLLLLRSPQFPMASRWRA